MWVAERTRLRIAGAVLAAGTLMLTTTGCNLLEQEEDPLVIDSYVTGVQVLGEAAESTELVRQQLGNGEADGPAAQVEQIATVVNGGSVQENISSEAEFTSVRVALESLPVSAPSASESTESEPAAAPTSTGAPSLGYHEIKLREASTSVGIVLTVNQTLPGQFFVLYFAAVDAAGKQGPLAAQSVEAVDVGTGNVQVSVSWDVDSDVDLHVVDPNGEEIYYGNLSSDSGGQLDLDSNPNCEIDGIRNENVTWQDTAPPGTYTVRVDLYAGCDVSPTNYVVTVQVAGQPSQTFTGSLTGAGDEGGEGSGVEVGTFEVTAAATQEG